MRRHPRLQRHPHHRRRSCLPKPTLTFTPTAWAKLLYLRDRGETEIGGFGVSAADNLLRVEDIGLVRQFCTPMTVAFEDESVAEFFDAQIDAGFQPAQFGRIWVHTHPGDSPFPSGTDEETFARVFARCDWAVMFILARGGQAYARLQWNIGPRGALQLPVEVDFSRPFAGSDHTLWEGDYQRCVISEWTEFIVDEASLPQPQHLLQELFDDECSFAH